MRFFIIIAFEVIYTIPMSFPTIANMLCRLEGLNLFQKNIFDDFGTMFKRFDPLNVILESEISVVILSQISTFLWYT